MCNFECTFLAKFFRKILEIFEKNLPNVTSEKKNFQKKKVFSFFTETLKNTFSHGFWQEKNILGLGTFSKSSIGENSKKKPGKKHENRNPLFLVVFAHALFEHIGNYRYTLHENPFKHIYVYDMVKFEKKKILGIFFFWTQLFKILFRMVTGKTGQIWANCSRNMQKIGRNGVWHILIRRKSTRKNL